MAIITFWSDGEKETGKTLSMAAIATQIAMENTYKILMFNSEQSDDTLERCFFERRRPKKTEMNLSNRTDLATGISGLSKAVLSNKTSPEIIKNYTKTIFRNRLEMLTEGKLTDEDYQNQRKTFKEIIKVSNKYYNLVLVDLSGNVNENITREILEMSDLIVVCVSQNLKRLDEFLELKRQTALFNNNKAIILIGKCDENSKYNSKNLLRYTGLREMLPITYNVQFFEASNEGKIADLFMRLKTKLFKDENTMFLEAVNEARDKILEKLKELRKRCLSNEREVYKMVVNIILIFVVAVLTVVLIKYAIKKNKEAEVVEDIPLEDKTFTIDAAMEFIKKRLDEITKVNLYDIGLSEEELQRRKAKKYELKKALKGCTYGDVNDKKYVKELIYDLLYREYGINETNISKSIPFDVPSLLTPQDKFDIIIFMYKKDFGYEALTQMIKKYDLAQLKFVAGETKPCYVITNEEINDIYEKEDFTLSFSDKLNVLTQRIYQHYKGYSSIDEVRDMNIDGVSGRSIWTSRKLC